MTAVITCFAYVRHAKQFDPEHIRHDMTRALLYATSRFNRVMVLTDISPSSSTVNPSLVPETVVEYAASRGMLTLIRTADEYARALDSIHAAKLFVYYSGHGTTSPAIVVPHGNSIVKMSLERQLKRQLREAECVFVMDSCHGENIISLDDAACAMLITSTANGQSCGFMPSSGGSAFSALVFSFFRKRRATPAKISALYGHVRRLTPNTQTMTVRLSHSHMAFFPAWLTN